MCDKTLDFCTSPCLCIQTIITLFGQSLIISESTYSYWLLCTPLQQVTSLPALKSVLTQKNNAEYTSLYSWKSVTAL